MRFPLFYTHKSNVIFLSLVPLSGSSGVGFGILLTDALTLRCDQKFLQALGYASTFAPDSDREERIQMHADKLYHKMLDYERAAEEAHAKNEPVPEPVSLFKSRQQTETTPATPVSAQDDGGDHSIPVPGGETLPPGAHWSKAPERLTPHEREVEVRIARQQMEMRHQYRGEVEDVLKEEEMAKRLRQEKFSKWFGPTVGKWLA